MSDSNVDRPAGGNGMDSETVPTWEDEYLERVSARLMYNYDLERNRTVSGRRFPMYGEMEIHNKKHIFHPALSFAHHYLYEHLFVDRIERITTADLETLVALGHDLADEWITPNELHYSTDFTFAVVTASLSDAIDEFVSSFKDRTLLKMGYHGHYEINLLVVDPSAEAIVASPEADVRKAFAVWESIEREEPSLLDLLIRRFQV